MERYVYPAEQRKALEGLSQPLAVYQFIDKRVVTLLLSDGFLQLFGYESRDEAVFKMDHDMYVDDHPDDVARIADAAVRFATEGGTYEVVYRTRDRAGTGYRIVHAKGVHVYTDDGVRLAQVFYTDEGAYVEGSDVSDLVLTGALSNALHELGLVSASHYDDLTGLPTMSYFFELAEATKRSIRSAGGEPALLYIDLAGMKFFNARHGFAEGDRMLQSLARLLARAFDNERCCRIGADHFAVIADELGLEETLDGIFRTFAGLFGKTTPPVHVGIYPYRIEDVSASSASDRAKLACVSLKGSYASAYATYDASLREDALLRQHIIENIDVAIREGWIKLYLQPIIRAVNGCICDVEALARWVDPEFGFLSPASFIPALEEAGLIHRLDLHMVDLVLAAIQTQIAEGFTVVPHSINLSRADFDACDIVEEIRSRVDAAGIPRDMITIEITESVIGRDFTFMKGQVERFRSLGFPVWMDDFGSGYSSLDVLQSLRFDLIKFDMSFMRRLDEGEEGRIVLTELMRMATALGLDTVTEGVESERQVRFLQEIGCSKLQGFYYSPPASFDEIQERHRVQDLIENENPAESDYYQSIGRVNLFDLGVIAASDEGALQNTFVTIPIAVLEVTGDVVRCIRCNRSYHDFMGRFFGTWDISDWRLDLTDPTPRYGAAFLAAVRQCHQTGTHVFFDESLAGGVIAHCFVRRVSTSPVTGSVAIAVAVLSVTGLDESTTYADIARTLAADYYNIYVIDLDTDHYVEYSSKVGAEELAIERQGEDFFGSARRDAMMRVFEGDRAAFLAAFTKENVLRELDAQGVFTITYRLVDTGVPIYVNMKITMMRGANRIIVGISIVDAQMRQLEEDKRLRQERASLARIAALSADYIVLYTVDPATGHYAMYDPTAGYESIGLAAQGDDFFRDVRLDAPSAIDPDDLERHLRVLTRENVMREIQQNGSFVHEYRLLMGGGSVPVRLRAVRVEEEGRDQIILGVSKVHEDLPRAGAPLEGGDAAELVEPADQGAPSPSGPVAYRKIAELSQSVSSLLTHMPALTFSKDVTTGVYLACNQGFAEYAHKETPEGVVGLTDFEIFDEQTAAHFVEDDRRALSMDVPYVFFEDVPDAAGHQRQFQTTKTKFVDGTGRQCLLGMCQDVTDAVRIKREAATTWVALEEARSASVIYTHLAQALAHGYTDLYYVNMDTDEFIEFHTDHERGVLSEARHGADFFEGCERDAKLYVHEDDQEVFVRAMNRDFLKEVLATDPVYEFTYRRIMGGDPFYVRMKVTRMQDDPRMLVLAVTDIDEQVRQRRIEERMLEEHLIYSRLQALSGSFVCVHVVDPVTGHYREFSATDDYVESFKQAREGEDFFATLRDAVQIFAYPEDKDRVLAVITRDRVMAEIERRGTFSLSYRVMKEGRPYHVQLRAAMVEEREGPRLVVGLNDIDVQVRQEKELERRIAQAQTKATVDALTGVKNMHAYQDEEARMNLMIERGSQPPFALVVCDVNNLKHVNDTLGHKAGDQYLRDACRVICDVFDHSPVYRIGGDEFAVISQGSDYEHIEELVARVAEYNAHAAGTGVPIIACGMARLDGDASVAAVFERADQRMYDNKAALKAGQQDRGA